MTGTEATEQRRPWSVATLIAFRFGTCYFGSFGLALLIGLIPVILAGVGIDGPWSALRGLIHVVRPPIEWIGTHLLRLPVQGVIDGEDYAGHRIHAWFTRMDPASFPLVERGFNWVQEQPYNR